MRIVWTEPARQDLRDIFEYIAEANPKAARTLLAEIKARVDVLIDQPQLGREGRVEGTRELVLTGNPIHFAVSSARPTDSGFSGVSWPKRMAGSILIMERMTWRKSKKKKNKSL